MESMLGAVAGRSEPECRHAGSGCIPSASQYHPDSVGRHGILRHRLLRRRDCHAALGFIGARGFTVYAVLQLGSVLSDPRLVADRPASASSRSGPYDGGSRIRGVSRPTESRVPDHRRGIGTCWLSQLRGREVACHSRELRECADQPKQMAIATRV